MVLTRNQKRKRLLLVNGKDEPDNKRSRDDTSSESSVEAEHIPTSPVEEEERGTDDEGVDDEGVDDNDNEDDDDSLISVDEDNQDSWVSLLEDPDYVEKTDKDEDPMHLSYSGLLHLLRKTRPLAAENLDQALKVIKDKTPTFMGLLEEEVEPEHRAKLLELYEGLKEYEAASESGHPYRLEYYNLRDRITEMTKKFRKRKAAKDRLTDIARTNLEMNKQSLEDAEVEVQSTLEGRILNLPTGRPNMSHIFRKYKRMISLRDSDDEKAKLNNWLYWATQIPHDAQVPTEHSSIADKLHEVAVGLDRELHGMEKVKEQILTFFNMRMSNPNSSGDVLALVGPPGTGKTSIARLLGEVLGVPFSQISFGGVKDSSFLKGHDYTYVGSQPGQIVKCLAHMKAKNGIIFMDEFEKVASDKNIIASLLHIVDRQQNSEYRDNYLSDLSIDLSNIWFVCSMNSPPKDSALRDRLFQIEVPGYSSSEKTQILKKHSIPKALSKAGLEDKHLQYTEEVLDYLVSKVSPNKSGVRVIENAIGEIVRKVAFLSRAHSNIDKYPFKISFDEGTVRELPVTLTKRMVDKFVTQMCGDGFENPPHGLYT